MRLGRILLSFALMPAVVVAQARTFDVGLSHVSQTNQEPGTALTFAGTLDDASAQGWFRASALAVLGVRAQTSAQLFAAGSRDLRAAGPVRPFVSATASAFAENGTGASESADASTGVRYSVGRYGVSIAGSGGAMTHGGASTTMLRAQSDAWMAIGRERFSANAAVTSSGARFDPQARLSGQGNSQQYRDVAGAWRHEQGPLSFGFTIGARNETAALRGGVWQASDAEVWLQPRLALVVSGGNTLADVRRGIPRTTYLTVAFRFANRPRALASIDGPKMYVDGSTDRRIDESTSRRIDIVGVSGTRVELMADFTRWEPVVLQRVGDVWRLEREITPGPHRLAIRIDGGPWITPANLPVVDDDFGGRVAILAVP